MNSVLWRLTEKQNYIDSDAAQFKLLMNQYILHRHTDHCISPCLVKAAEKKSVKPNLPSLGLDLRKFATKAIQRS